MAMALLAVAAVKAVQGYEQAQGAIAQAKNERTLGYQVADANETRVRASNALALGEQRASAVESGFDANSGSLADIQTKSAGNLELDALNQRYSGQLTAWRAKTQIAGAQAGFKNALATAAVTAATGAGGASSSLFSGFASSGSAAAGAVGGASSGTAGSLLSYW